MAPDHRRNACRPRGGPGRAYCQPKICLASGRVVGLKALARWCHPERGLLTPGQFAPALDHPETSIMIWDAMLRQLGVTDADLSRWRDGFLAGGAASLKSRPEDDRDRQLRAMSPRHEGEDRRPDHGERASGGEDRPDGDRRPFYAAEVEEMSRTVLPSAKRAYGLGRVCRRWGLSRATIWRHCRAVNLPKTPRRRPGPQGPMPEDALASEIRALLATSPFHGEGYRKVWPGCVSPALGPACVASSG